jgi:hypothetical protein
MDRRTFLAGTGAVLLAAPLAAEAQVPSLSDLADLLPAILAARNAVQRGKTPGEYYQR